MGFPFVKGFLLDDAPHAHAHARPHARGWRNTVGKPHRDALAQKSFFTGLNLLVCAWKTEGYSFTEFEVSNGNISTVFRQPLDTGAPPRTRKSRRWLRGPESICLNHEQIWCNRKEISFDYKEISLNHKEVSFNRKAIPFGGYAPRGRSKRLPGADRATLLLMRITIITLIISNNNTHDNSNNSNTTTNINNQ